MNTNYSHLLLNQEICSEIDTSGSATEHELGDLAKFNGYPSLRSCLNDMNAWKLTVAQVAAILLKTNR